MHSVLQSDKFSHKGVYLSHLIAEVNMSTVLSTVEQMMILV